MTSKMIQAGRKVGLGRSLLPRSDPVRMRGGSYQQGGTGILFRRQEDGYLTSAPKMDSTICRDEMVVEQQAKVA